MAARPPAATEQIARAGADVLSRAVGTRDPETITRAAEALGDEELTDGDREAVIEAVQRLQAGWDVGAVVRAVGRRSARAATLVAAAGISVAELGLQGIFGNPTLSAVSGAIGAVGGASIAGGRVGLTAAAAAAGEVAARVDEATGIARHVSEGVDAIRNTPATVADVLTRGLNTAGGATQQTFSGVLRAGLYTAATALDVTAFVAPVVAGGTPLEPGARGYVERYYGEDPASVAAATAAAAAERGMRVATAAPAAAATVGSTWASALAIHAPHQGLAAAAAASAAVDIYGRPAAGLPFPLGGQPSFQLSLPGVATPVFNLPVDDDNIAGSAVLEGAWNGAMTMLLAASVVNIAAGAPRGAANALAWGRRRLLRG